MATRQLCAYLCIMFLLLAVASAGAQAPPPPDPAASADPFDDPADAPNTGDPAAAGRIDHAEAICYKTATSVPRKCARQFIRAIFMGRTVTDFAITADCCHRLACVREWTCADVLRGVCVPPERDLCPPPQATWVVGMARESSARTTKQ